MAVNPKVQEIVDKVALKFAEYTTPESITPMVVTQAIAEAIQNLFVPRDLFMVGANVTEIDLTDYFNVERIFAQNNNFSSLDLSLVPNLVEFYVTGQGNGDALDFSQNPLIQVIDVEYFSSSNNTQDLSNNPLLRYLKLESNKVTSIDISGCIALEKIILSGNPNLATIDITTCLATLKEIWLSDTNVVTPNFSNAIVLEIVELGDVPVTSVNVSNCPNLVQLGISNSLLSVAEINSILAQLVANNANNGRLSLYTQPYTEQPTGQGLIDKATLQGRGWNIRINN